MESVNFLQFVLYILQFHGSLKKYIRCILVILLASTIHQTALIMLPIIFIVQGKPWNKKTIATSGIALVALVASTQFTDFLNVAMEDTVYVANI